MWRFIRDFVADHTISGGSNRLVFSQKQFLGRFLTKEESGNDESQARYRCRYFRDEYRCGRYIRIGDEDAQQHETQSAWQPAGGGRPTIAPPQSQGPGGPARVQSGEHESVRRARVGHRPHRGDHRRPRQHDLSPGKRRGAVVLVDPGDEGGGLEIFLRRDRDRRTRAQCAAVDPSRQPDDCRLGQGPGLLRHREGCRDVLP